MSTAAETLSRLILSERNVGDPERWASVVAGAAIAAYGLTRRDLGGSLLAVVGGAMLWRGSTGHCPVYGVLGISTADDDAGERAVSVPYGRGIRVERTVSVDATPDRLFAFWRNLSNLPRFMRHLESVTMHEGGRRSRWVARGPAGIDARWEAEIINEIPNELIAWRSVDGSRVDNAGSVHFSRSDRGTDVRVILRYDPPAGPLGAAFARIFGEDPGRQIEEDLGRFKVLMEAGENAWMEALQEEVADRRPQ